MDQNIPEARLKMLITKIQYLVKQYDQNGDLNEGQKLQLFNQIDELQFRYHISQDEQMRASAFQVVNLSRQILQGYEPRQNINPSKETFRYLLMEQTTKATYLIKAINGPKQVTQMQLDKLDQLKQKILRLKLISIQQQEIISMEALLQQIDESILSGTKKLESQSIKQEYHPEESLDENDQCSICLLYKKKYSTVPCGHFIYCELCVKQLKGTCLMCRQKVDSVIKIFQ